MKKKKIKLESLNVQSFITNLNEEKKNTIVGQIDNQFTQIFEGTICMQYSVTKFVYDTVRILTNPEVIKPSIEQSCFTCNIPICNDEWTDHIIMCAW